ncbi:TIGR03016 family PEP-CTERM system-associated outer membrane protein [Aestuariibacter sp. AA17]|uniref:TIGR03016 family PEP-CTERM system-associated outer membrane protein n=1 Tax=Fluctibacter corallii TaxID=2984329 RepID=A0ABT3ABL5_9ALTE|nr:TIGR03016 family PEP-CTERM system-associated outer membrane protein [Aestuariibacter sp. AA17]MCV2886053.1 TIGR03016 family PEP-CTERM system-associated outer membrane protein [Aestuariibacter sp. AA17]
MRLKLAALSLSIISSYTFGGDLTISPSVSAGYIVSDITLNDSESQDVQSFEVSPSAVFSYDANRFDASLAAEHKYIRRNDDFTTLFEGIDKEQSFTNFGGNMSFEAIDRVLSFDVGAKQQYRDIDPSTALINGFYSNSQSLTKSNAYNAGVDFSLQNGKYVRASISADVDKVETDATINRNIGLDRTNSRATAVLTSGRWFNRIRWDISSSYSKSDGSQGRGQANDSIFRSVMGNLRFGIIDNLDFVVTASEFSNTLVGNDALSTELDFKSYGAGLSWRELDGTLFTVTYNQGEKSTDSEKENYIAADLNLPLSRRTALKANYSRRFFGESGSLDFTYKARRFNGVISYNENLTTYSRLQSISQTIGLFACPIGSLDFTTCVQTSPDYEPQAGEEIIPIAFINPEISEEVILRKTLTGGIGYNYRKLSFGVNLSYSDVDYLETNRTQRNKTVTVSAGLDASAKSSFSLNVNFAELTRAETTTTEDLSNATFTYSYRFSKQLKSNLELGYSDREGATAQRDYNETRVRWNVSYQFN